MSSDLEQARVLAHADVVTLLFFRELTLASLNDNVAAVSQNCKGAITSDQATAYLCHLSSLHHHCYHYHHKVSHIEGKANAMADILSQQHDLTDLQLLTLFNTHFPQDMPWHMCRLSAAMLLALTSSLWWKQPNTALWLQPKLIEPICLPLGWISPCPLTKSPSSKITLPTCIPISSSSLVATAMGSSLAAASLLVLNVWRKPYMPAPWGRSLPDWASWIPSWMTPTVFHFKSLFKARDDEDPAPTHV